MSRCCPEDHGEPDTLPRETDDGASWHHQTSARDRFHALHNQLVARKITKREFMRQAIALGIPMGVAMMAAQSSGPRDEDIA